MDIARRAAERAARNSYGRLVALLSARGGDIALAEDALADAFAAALRTWPERGVPDNPDAWLLTAARRTIGHVRARTMTASSTIPTLLQLEEERAQQSVPFGDERLKLMFVCAHPAIEAAVQAPLMLQAVLGLDAARIAASFLVSPAAMGQKLVRAKAKIRDAAIGFVIPAPDQGAVRVAGVLEAIYAAYGTGWEDVFASDSKNHGLSEEAIWLARLVADFLPGNPEALGLLSLVLHCEARKAARRDPAGRFVPLDRQDPRMWQHDMVVEAESLLRNAARFALPGRFQVEAAIQSLHAQTVMTGQANAAALMQLYDMLVAISPSVGARVARACAYAEGGQAGLALVQLQELAERARSYQPWWAAQARTLHLLGRSSEAVESALTAAGLSADPAVRLYLLSGELFG